eukprot:284816359_2
MRKHPTRIAKLNGTRHNSRLSALSASFPGTPSLPELAARNAIGLHSYRSRSFPLGSFLVGGYRKIPPLSRLRWKSAIKLPTRTAGPTGGYCSKKQKDKNQRSIQLHDALTKILIINLLHLSLNYLSEFQLYQPNGSEPTHLLALAMFHIFL